LKFLANSPCYSFRQFGNSKPWEKPEMNGKPAVTASARAWRLLAAFVACAILLALCASPASAQKDKKKKKDAPAASDTQPIIPMSDEQQIDYMISTMLGAWQIGDADRLHQTYADDAMFISGTWGPPVIGWSNYVVLYQQQRARIQQIRMDRSNTYIKVQGAFGWACYQWEFAATVDGQPMSSQGQTTLVVEKRNSRWVIVHNHTSVAQTPMPVTPANPTNAPPATQPQPVKPPSR
jgi:ketosteroid isomerase-like protein